MLAHAFLAAIAAQTTCDHSDVGDFGSDRGRPSRLTCNEIRHLIAALLIRPARDLTHILRWSRWRRTSNARASASHYTRQQRSLT